MRSIARDEPKQQRARAKKNGWTLPLFQLWRRRCRQRRRHRQRNRRPQQDRHLPKHPQRLQHRCRQRRRRRQQHRRRHPIHFKRNRISLYISNFLQNALVKSLLDEVLNQCGFLNIHGCTTMKKVTLFYASAALRQNRSC